MKKDILVTLLVFAGIVFCLNSCKRDFALKDPTMSTNGTSFLKVIDFSPNFRPIYSLPDSFNVFVNGTKVTGFTPGGAGNYILTYGALFPTVSSGYGYISIPPGTTSIKLSVGGVVNPDSIPIATFTKILMPNSNYSFIITDSITSPRDSSQIFVQDSYPQPNPGFYNLRFIHAVWNDTVGKTVDVWSTRTNRNIYTNVKPGTITSFTELPYNQLFTDTLYVRRSGTTNNLAILNSLSLFTQRTYTLLYKGDGNLVTGTKARGLITYVHQ